MNCTYNIIAVRMNIVILSLEKRHIVIGADLSLCIHFCLQYLYYDNISSAGHQKCAPRYTIENRYVLIQAVVKLLEVRLWDGCINYIITPTNVMRLFCGRWQRVGGSWKYVPDEMIISFSHKTEKLQFSFILYFLCLWMAPSAGHVRN